MTPALTNETLAGIKRRGQPLQVLAINGDHVKSTRWPRVQRHQIMLSTPNTPPLLAVANAGGSPTVFETRALAHLDKHQSALRIAHDQINFSAMCRRTSRHPIIAGNQHQALRL